MKKTSYATIAPVIALVTLAMTGQVHAQTASATKTTTAAVPAAPTVAPTAPKAPVAPAMGVQPPTAPQAPVAPTAAPSTASAATPATSASTAAAPKAGDAVAAPGKKGAPEDLRQAMHSGDFLKKLSWPLTEQQMVEFARASVKVGKINSKWDVQIASAETDQMSIEYSNLAVEEIQHAIKNIPGLTIAQYNELTAMTASDKEFNSIYLAYKQLVLEGDFGEVPKGGALPTKKDDASSAPVSAAAPYGTAIAPVTDTNATPLSTSASSGTALTPLGSPKPPYSPPATH